jgi:hypothetical protein
MSHRNTGKYSKKVHKRFGFVVCGLCKFFKHCKRGANSTHIICSSFEYNTKKLITLHNSFTGYLVVDSPQPKKWTYDEVRKAQKEQERIAIEKRFPFWVNISSPVIGSTKTFCRECGSKYTVPVFYQRNNSSCPQGHEVSIKEPKACSKCKKKTAYYSLETNDYVCRKCGKVVK